MCKHPTSVATREMQMVSLQLSQVLVQKLWGVSRQHQLPSATAGGTRGRQELCTSLAVS